MSQVFPILALLAIVAYFAFVCFNLLSFFFPTPVEPKKPTPRRRFTEQVIRSNLKFGSRGQGSRKEGVIENSIDYDNYGGTD